MNASEQLFVVDEHDCPIDVRARSEIHQLGLRHRAVHIFLWNTAGQLLIHLRAEDKEEFPGVWSSSAAGHVAAGDDYDSTARRELQEELGISAEPNAIAKVDACPQTCQEFTKLYSAVSDAEIKFDPVEIQQVRWVTIDDLKTEINNAPLLFSPAFLLLLRTYLQQMPTG